MLRMIVDKTNQIPEFHLFVVNLDHIFIEASAGFEHNEKMMKIIMNIIQIFEIPAEKEPFLCFIFYLKIIILLVIHDFYFL